MDDAHLTRRRLLLWPAAASLVASNVAAFAQTPAADAGVRERPLGGGGAGAAAASARPPERFADTTALLDDIEQRTFAFFWDTTDARTGLAPDRWPTPSPCSVAAVGFALTAYTVGVERRFVTRAQAAERVLTTLRTLLALPQGPQAVGMAGHKGFFYHFIDIKSGARAGRCELSTVDTALLLAGVLTCQSYFDGNAQPEQQIRDAAAALYARVDWRWAQTRGPSICHGWHPESGFIRYDWKGYNEAMLLYLLALGAPAETAVGDDAWDAWTSTYDRASWGADFGQPHLRFAPAFGHQFTQCWVDLRGLRDPYMRRRGFDYFENSRRATYAQRAYAQANPGGWAGYGGDIWGVTASDGPADVWRPYGGRQRRFISYAGRGMGLYDDGTLAPYGCGASIAFAPEIVVPALAALHERHGRHIYGRYGFFDAFNESFTFDDVPLRHGRVVTGFGWADTDHLGIDQGPLLAMLANHRGSLVWDSVRRNPHIQRGLQRARFA